ncbi:MAG TPA: hypothetical protein VM940_04000 [Chthoniobacterales bacterium]|jgi:hypothetical protein|nr:hypothetical protein [Chthoniobacterales bacterium]
MACAAALWQTTAFALPGDEIGMAVRANGAAHVASAQPKQFVKAFTAVAFRAEARALPEYVLAAVHLRPELAPTIVAVAIKAAIKKRDAKAGALCSIVERIVMAGIAANPDAAVAIARSASSAALDFRRCVVSAAISAAPAKKDAILQAATARSASFASLTFSASDSSGFSFTAATLNPANISDLSEDDAVASPEQAPAN